MASLGGVNFFARPERVFGTNERVRVAVVRLPGQGWYHVKKFSGLPGVKVGAIFDVDQNVSSQPCAETEKMGLPKSATFVDFRKLLEDEAIDAVSIATPNFWHSFQAIWACQVGKDVYCEKPMCHNIWEGRQVLRAVEKYDRIVQRGTQSRSGNAVQDAKQKMRDGLIGEVYLARGRVLPPSKCFSLAAGNSARPGMEAILVQWAELIGCALNVACPTETRFLMRWSTRRP